MHTPDEDPAGDRIEATLAAAGLSGADVVAILDARTVKARLVTDDEGGYILLVGDIDLVFAIEQGTPRVWARQLEAVRAVQHEIGRFADHLQTRLESHLRIGSIR